MRKVVILEITIEKGYTNNMVKTLLKSVLIVLVLAGVFFFAFQMWENRQAKMAAAPTPTESFNPTPFPTSAPPTIAPIPTEPPLPTPEPTERPKVKKRTKSSSLPATRKKATTKKTTKKSSRKSIKPMEEFDDAGEPEPLIPEMTAPAPEPEVAKAPPPPAPSKGGGDTGPVDLDQLFNESQLNQPEPAPLAPEPPSGGGSTKDDSIPSMDSGPVAAIPPSNEGVFGTGSTANLPKVTNISVEDVGGITTVTIDLEKRAKVNFLRMRNPSRVSVEIHNAANNLKAEYSAFAGTRVKKITTQQFPGKDETITRVMIFVDGNPNIEPSAKGNSIVLRLP
jgi:hypothetical protein